MSQENTKRVHFIAIGGSAMHNLALALHQQGFHVTGSDDEINEPSRSRLAKAGLLPEQIGWFPEKINKDLSAVILGMHARIDNPELLKAQELGLPIYSYPEYLYKQSENKQRVVIAGSHGKTSITSMILHVLKFHQREFDYMVGAQLEGFDTMVKLSDAPVIVIEGDEYFASPLDRTPKFLHYKHHIGLISGIAWDHINVYPTFEEYVKQFEAFADASPKGSILLYSDNDDLAEYICEKERDDVTSIEYPAHKHEIIDGTTYLTSEFGRVPLQIFGKHNMRNISGAKLVCSKLGITDEMFYQAIRTFKGAANRLEVLNKNYSTIIFKDFAHAPSKVKATTNAVKKQYERKDLVAVLELHTFSSLTKEFLVQYKDCFKSADVPVVYFNPETIKHKKLQEINNKDVTEAFACDNLHVFTSSADLENYLKNIDWNGKNLLLMSSGNFGGIDLKALAKELVED
ncbi:MAG: Mur ligase family protein [Cytophagaceae bacterium]|jgi:UDP-N-acetylmuramate: L-alanyl-gamma-D-glutamyl-meso-diaminopimelate ligase|nr:Mur ligase family protein [Cytophagaceae bacterium]